MVIGKYGHEKKNYNTFFVPKDLHNYTIEVASRNERSIIDFIIICTNA